MGSQQDNGNPVLRLYVRGNAVTVRFSEEESEDLKRRIRDILTGAYGERLQGETAGQEERTADMAAALI